jgi:hypothetical protein
LSPSRLETRSFELQGETFSYPVSRRFTTSDRYLALPELICDGQYVSLSDAEYLYRVSDGLILINQRLGDANGRDPEKWEAVYESLAHWWASELMFELFMQTLPPEIKATIKTADETGVVEYEPVTPTHLDPLEFWEMSFSYPMCADVRPAIVQLNRNTEDMAEELWSWRTNTIDLPYPHLPYPG